VRLDFEFVYTELKRCVQYLGESQTLCTFKCLSNHSRDEDIFLINGPRGWWGIGRTRTAALVWGRDLPNRRSSYCHKSGRE